MKGGSDHILWCGVGLLPLEGGEGQRIGTCVWHDEDPSPTCWDRCAQHHEGMRSSSTRREGRSAPSATNSKSLWALCRSSAHCRQRPNCRTASAAGGRQGPAIAAGPGPIAAARASQELVTAPTAGDLEPEVTSNVTAAPELAALNAYTHPVSQIQQGGTVKHWALVKV